MPQVEPKIPLFIDSTAMRTFRNCPQRYYNEFILGLTSDEGINPHLHAGGCLASALEDVYEQIYIHNWSQEDAIDLASAKFDIRWQDYVPPERIYKTRERTWAAVLAYFKKWPALHDPCRPYFNDDGKPTFEFSFSLPLNEENTGIADWPLNPASQEPWLYSGRFDFLGNIKGVPVIRDEKTTGSIGATWSSKWRLRSQFLGYVWACRSQGIPIQRVIVRGIAIQARDIKLAEAEPLYSDFLIQRWLHQLRRDLWRLTDCIEQGYFDYNLDDGCTSYGMCPFMDLCASRNPAGYYKDFGVRHWDPLAARD